MKYFTKDYYKYLTIRKSELVLILDGDQERTLGLENDYRRN